MVDFIDVHYSDVVSLRILSTSIGRQPAYLGRLFRQEVGSSFHEYLTQIRMEHAAELIRDGVKVEAVALCVGYRSKKNFYQQFRRHYATTPGPYRCRTDVAAQPECHKAVAVLGGAQRAVAVADTPRSRSVQKEQPIASDTESVLGRLSSLLRASNRAWRLAVRAQDTMLQHFTALQVGTLLTNDAGKYIAANRAAVAVTGYLPTELYELSPMDLFVSAPSMDARCVWQLLLKPIRPDQQPNAVVRTKDGNSLGVHLVTLRNLLWGRTDMSAMLDELPSVARVGTSAQ
jgi:PAS domain S-box-containing protein